jgi:hypothetical protein
MRKLKWRAFNPLKVTASDPVTYPTTHRDLISYASTVGSLRTKRDIIQSRHVYLLEICGNEVERLQMQREEGISMVNEFHHDKFWYLNQSMVYDYTNEYQGATQKQKVKQRAIDEFSKSIVDDMVEGSGDMSELMTARNEFLWNRSVLIARVVSRGEQISPHEFRIPRHELKGDVLSVIKTLQLVECICKRKTVSSENSYDINQDLLVECAKHVGYSFQFLRYLWNLLQDRLNANTIGSLAYHQPSHDKPTVSYNIEDDSLTGEIDEELLFGHISALMEQLFSSLNALLNTSQAIYRTPLPSSNLNQHHYNKSNQQSRKSSLNPINHLASYLPETSWSWGSKYEFKTTMSASYPSTGTKYHQIVEHPLIPLTDDDMCEELLYWSLVFYQCKIKVRSSTSSLNRRSSIDVLEGSFSTYHNTLKYYSNSQYHRSHSTDFYSKRYDFIIQRMLYQGSPLMLDILGSCYSFITFYTANASLTDPSQPSAFHVPPAHLKDLMVSSLAISEYLIEKVSFTMMTAYEKDSSPMGNVTLTNLELLRALDDEIVIANQIVSACFASGIITSSSLAILEIGLSFTHSRRDNYFIQVSWLNALLLSAMCILQGGWTEHEINRLLKMQYNALPSQPLSKHHNSVTSYMYIDVDMNDTPESSPRARLLKLLHHQCSIRIIEVMNYHRHSLSILHSGLLGLRILFRPSFMRRIDVENILTISDFEDMDKILIRIKYGSKEEEDQYYDEVADQIFGDLIHMTVEEADIQEEQSNIRDMFHKWKNRMFQKELHVLSNFKADDYVSLLSQISDTHLQYPEIIEQIMLTVYELSTVSSFAKHSFIESGISTSFRRYAWSITQLVSLTCSLELYPCAVGSRSYIATILTSLH